MLDGRREPPGGGTVSSVVSSDVILGLSVKQIVSSGSATLVLTKFGSVYSLESTADGGYSPSVSFTLIYLLTKLRPQP